MKLVCVHDASENIVMCLVPNDQQCVVVAALPPCIRLWQHVHALPSYHPNLDSASDMSSLAPFACGCARAGPGLAGGAAGTPAVLTITARDSNRRRITEGGNSVSVTVFPGQGVGNDVSPVQATVTDRNDGSYIARFTVPAKGNYTIKVCRELLGTGTGCADRCLRFSSAVTCASSGCRCLLL